MFPKYKNNQISTVEKKTQTNKIFFSVGVDWVAGAERFILAVKLENGYKPEQSASAPGSEGG